MAFVFFFLSKAPLFHKTAVFSVEAVQVVVNSARGKCFFPVDNRSGQGDLFNGGFAVDSQILSKEF